MAEAGAAGPGHGGRDAVGDSLPAPEPPPAFQIADSRDLAEVAREATRGREPLPRHSEPARPAPPEGWTPTNTDPLAYLKGDLPGRSRPRLAPALRRRIREVSRRTWATALATALVVAAVAAVPVVGLPLDRPIAHNRPSPTTEAPAPVRRTTTTRKSATTTAFTYPPAPAPSSTTVVPPAAPAPSAPISVRPAPTAGRAATTTAPRRAATTAPRRSSTTRAPATTSPPPPPRSPDPDRTSPRLPLMASGRALGAPLGSVPVTDTAAPSVSLPSRWRHALRTGSPPRGAPLDPVTRWLVLTRAAVLPMTISAGAIGGLLAVGHPRADWGLFTLAFVGIVLAHMANNLMNDLFDAEVGLDTADYPRALYAPHPILSGMISRKGLATASIVVNLLDLAIGIWLVKERGWAIAGFALGGFLLSAAYTAPPLRLKKHGLGELDVAIVWGPLMVGGTYYATTGEIPALVLLASIPYSLLCVAVLMGKHVDKLEWDEREGVRTLPVILGEPVSRTVTRGLLAAFYVGLIAAVALRCAALARAPRPRRPSVGHPTVEGARAP